MFELVVSKAWCVWVVSVDGSEKTSLELFLLDMASQVIEAGRWNSPLV